MTSSCLAKQFTEMMCGPLASGPARLHPGSTQDLTNQQLWGKGSHTGVNKYLGDSCVQPRMRTHRFPKTFLDFRCSGTDSEASNTERKDPRDRISSSECLKNGNQSLLRRLLLKDPTAISAPHFCESQSGETVLGSFQL